MKTIVQDRFGPPDVLQLVDANRPEIDAGEVLLEVHAAAVNPYDWHILRGDPRIARLMGGVGLTQAEGPNSGRRRRRPGRGGRHRGPRPPARR